MGETPARFMAGIPERNHEMVYVAMEHVLDRARLVMGGLSLQEADIKEHWWLYLAPMQRILKTFVKINPLDAAERLENGQHGHGYRLFPLIPVNTLTQKHLLISTSVLRDLLVLTFKGDRTMVIPPSSVFVHERAYWWSLAFNFRRVTTDRREFRYYMTTDGVQLSVGIQTPNIIPAVYVNDYGFDYERHYHAIDLTRVRRKVGIDPGRKVFVAASWGPTRRDGLLYGIGEWREDSGATYLVLRHAAWMRNNRRMQLIVTTMPTACCATFGAFVERLVYFLVFRDEMLDFYAVKRWRRIKWKTSIKRQKAYDKICDLITGGDPTTVVAYGGGSFHHASRGHPPTPYKRLYKELKKHCRVRLVPEYKTSQVCSLCHGLEEGEIGDGEVLKQTRRWSFKKCETIGCLMLWNRDVNAARNIRYIFLYRNDHNGERQPPDVELQDAL